MKNIGCCKYVRYEINGRAVFVMLPLDMQHADVVKGLATAKPVSAGMFGMQFDISTVHHGSMTLKLAGDPEDKDIFVRMTK